MSRAAAAGVAGLGTPGNRPSAVIDPYAYMESRERREALRNKGRRFVNTTKVPVWAKDDQGRVVIGKNGKPVQRGEVVKGDKYLACGVRRQDSNAGVDVKWDGEGTRAGLGNLQACGSVWACPVCAAQIQRERAEDLRKVLVWCQNCGHTIVMLTMTVRHYQRDSLEDLVDAVTVGWAGVTTGSQWASESEDRFQERLTRWVEASELYRAGVPGARAPRGYHQGKTPQRRIGDQERYGILGWVRSLEVTSGRHGWHPHLHVVMVFEGRGEQTDVNVQVAAERMHARFRSALNRAGFDSDRDNGGFHLLVGEQAEEAVIEYISKDQGSDTAEFRDTADSISREATMGAWKKGRRAGKTPFQMLALIDYDALPKESPRLEARWREFVDTMEGRRQMTWSTGLRELAGMAADERTDEEIAAEDRGGQTVLTIDADAWDGGLCRLSTTIRDVVEVEGVDGLRAFLDRAGWTYTLPSVERMEQWYEDDTPEPVDLDPALF